MKCIFLSLLVLLSFSATSQRVRTKTIRVEPYLEVTNGAFFKTLSLKTNNPLVNELKGFDFTWGYRYKLVVSVPNKGKRYSPIKQQQPQDVSSVQYQFVKVASKSKVDASFTFNMRLERDFYLGEGEQKNNFSRVNDSTYRYFDAIQLVVPPHLKEAFNAIIEKGENHIGTFSFIDEQTIKLMKLDE